MNLLHCDNTNCDQTVDSELPYGWLKLERLSPVSVLGQRDVYHFCSMECLCSESYRLIHGDHK